MANNFSLPSVGQGGSFSVGSDRYPVTVVAVTAKTVKFQEADAAPAEGHNYFGAQKYTFSPNTNSRVETARWSAKRGGWVSAGRRVSFTGYSKYSDPHF